MGKRRALELLVVLVCSLCSGPAIRAQGTLRVGAARVDITPPADPAHRPSGKYAHEKLYVRAIVLDNGSVRAALVAADQGGLSETIWQAASKQIAAELHCPVENIVMSATHTHSGWGPGGFPGMRGLRPDPNAPPPPLVGQILDADRRSLVRFWMRCGKPKRTFNRRALDSVPESPT